MKVFFDDVIFSSQKYGGISRYFFELVKKNITFEAILDFKYTINRYLLDSENEFGKEELILKNRRFENFKFPGKHRLEKLLSKYFDKNHIEAEHLNRKMILNRFENSEFDIFHPTYYDDYFLPYIKEKPFVLTVYDMIHEIYPEHFSPSDTTSRIKQKLMEKANHIIAISEKTKNDIISITGISEKKISVVHLASSYSPETVSIYFKNQMFKLPAKYILFTGVRTGYKNFYFFLNALLPLLKCDRDLFLVCTGNSFSDSEKELFKILGCNDRILHYFCNDNQLITLYKNAELFVFPSLYEGFGIPVLESFACGCPALISNTASLPEVGADGAIYFNPKDMHDLREKIRLVLGNSVLKSELRDKGYRQLKKFSWDKTVKETNKVYLNVLSHIG